MYIPGNAIHCQSKSVPYTVLGRAVLFPFPIIHPVKKVLYIINNFLNTITRKEPNKP